jgi:hypothetical protein
MCNYVYYVQLIYQPTHPLNNMQFMKKNYKYLLVDVRIREYARYE